MADDDDLVDRFESWVEGVVRSGRFWILVGPTGENAMQEDHKRNRDLHLLYPTEADAAADAERPTDQDVRPDSIETDELPNLCDAAEGRGEAFKLWDGDWWIVAEPDVLREELEQYME